MTAELRQDKGYILASEAPEANFNPEKKTVLVSSSAGQLNGATFWISTRVHPPYGHVYACKIVALFQLEGMSGSCLQTMNTTKNSYYHLANTVVP